MPYAFQPRAIVDEVKGIDFVTFEGWRCLFADGGHELWIVNDVRKDPENQVCGVH